MGKKSLTVLRVRVDLDKKSVDKHRAFLVRDTRLGDFVNMHEQRRQRQTTRGQRPCDWVGKFVAWLICCIFCFHVFHFFTFCCSVLVYGVVSLVSCFSVAVAELLAVSRCLMLQVKSEIGRA